MEAKVREILQGQIRILRSFKAIALQLGNVEEDVSRTAFLDAPYSKTAVLREERIEVWATVSGVLKRLGEVLSLMEAGGGGMVEMKARDIVNECDQALEALYRRTSLRASLEEKAREQIQGEQA